MEFALFTDISPHVAESPCWYGEVAARRILLQPEATGGLDFNGSLILYFGDIRFDKDNPGIPMDVFRFEFAHFTVFPVKSVNKVFLNLLHREIWRCQYRYRFD